MASEQPKPTSPGETAVGVATQTGPDLPMQLPELPSVEKRISMLDDRIRAIEDTGLAKTTYAAEHERLATERNLVSAMGVKEAWIATEAMFAHREGRDPNPLPWRVPENAQTAEAPASPGDAQGSNGLKLPQE